jgi:hypothetical protein
MNTEKVPHIHLEQREQRELPSPEIADERHMLPEHKSLLHRLIESTGFWIALVATIIGTCASLVAWGFKGGVVSKSYVTVEDAAEDRKAIVQNQKDIAVISTGMTSMQHSVDGLVKSTGDFHDFAVKQLIENAKGSGVVVEVPASLKAPTASIGSAK